MPVPINQETIDQVSSLLSGRLDIDESEPLRLVVCGGAALIAMDLRRRTTRDVDVVALLSSEHEAISPDPLPDFLLKAAEQVGCPACLEYLLSHHAGLVRAAVWAQHCRDMPPADLLQVGRIALWRAILHLTTLTGASPFPPTPGESL